MDRVLIGRFPWSCKENNSEEDAYKELAATIVLQAVKDYIKTIRKMWNPKLSVRVKRRAVPEKEELEGFFYSPWYDTLCDIDPGKLVYNCHLRAEEQEREAIKKQNRKQMNRLLKEAARKDGIPQ